MIGVLLVGGSGATGSTLIGGSVAMAMGKVVEEFGLTSAGAFCELPLISTKDIVWGGWDLETSLISDVIAAQRLLPPESAVWCREAGDVEMRRGVVFDRDFAAHDMTSVRTSDSWDTALEQLRSDIRDFKRAKGIEDAIVINLSNPPTDDIAFSMRQASCVAYAEAAIREGCHFIEFTPSPSLDDIALDQLAKDHEVQLAGRDGSTGQTMLKAVLGHLFGVRNLQITSWYSTNLLGNHDGFVLSQPQFAAYKLRDKLDVLAPLVRSDDVAHTVRIEYLEDRGDNKEAWDSVRIRGWLGSNHSLALHWVGQDSFLAAPILLDLIRLVEFGKRQLNVAGGLQPQLGAFFKRPLGREGIPWSDQYKELERRYCDYSTNFGHD